MTEARFFLSRSEFVERIGVKMDTLDRYKLPGPDAIIGASGKRATSGWLLETVDAWNAARPGKGGRPPKNTSTK